MIKFVRSAFTGSTCFRIKSLCIFTQLRNDCAAAPEQLVPTRLPGRATTAAAPLQGSRGGGSRAGEQATKAGGNSPDSSLKQSLF